MTLEAVAIGLALAYVLLAMGQSRLCWIAAFISAVIYLYIFANVKLYMEAGLQLVYAGMAVVGWAFWGRDRSDESLAVTTRPLRFHLSTIIGILLMAGIVGSLLTTYTDAARPYIDSMTTLAAVAATWMVTQKILENWLYWFVINTVSVWLFMDRGLNPTAALFALYIMLSVIGYFVWRKTLLAHES